MKRNYIFALIVIFIGLFLLLQNLGIIKASLSLLIIGFGFIGAYIFLGYSNKSKNILLLVPGVLILGLYVYTMIISSTGFYLKEVLFFLLLSLCFFIIYMVHSINRVYANSYKKYWSILIGIISLSLSLMCYIGRTKNFFDVYTLFRYLWPIILILIGLFLLITYNLDKNNN